MFKLRAEFGSIHYKPSTWESGSMRVSPRLARATDFLSQKKTGRVNRVCLSSSQAQPHMTDMRLSGGRLE